MFFDSITIVSLICIISRVITAANAHSTTGDSDWNFGNGSASSFNLDARFPPITPLDIIRGISPHGYRGNVKKLHQTLRKAVSKKSLNIIVLGGSLPYGAGLEPHTFRDCWPTQLQNILHKIYKFKIKVNNLAIRAVSSDAQASLRFNYIKNHIKSSVDLVIVDIGLNDKPHHDPEFRENVAHFEGEEGITPAARESSLIKERKKQGEGRLLMQLLLHFTSPSTSILYFETFAGGGKTNPVIHTYDDLKGAQEEGFTNGVYSFEEKNISSECFPDVGRYYHFQALVEYKIPIISYPDIICPIHNLSYWGSPMHHPKEYHRFTAYLIALSIYMHSENDLSETRYDSRLPFSRDRITNWNLYIQNTSTDQKLRIDSKLFVCILSPLSYMAINRPKKFKPFRKGNAWKYYMDVPNKPGWIAESVQVTSNEDSFSDLRSREIVFPIVLSTDNPVMRLSFLRSYNFTMGKLSCCVSGDSTSSHCESNAISYIFDGHWDDQTSQGVAVPVQLSKTMSAVNASDTQKTMRRNIVCAADKGKFKVIGLVGC